MKIQAKITFLIFILYMCGCSSPGIKTGIKENIKKDSVPGKIEWYDKTASSLIDTNATIVIIGRGFNWCEGPVWIADKKMLLFSDVPENKIFQWKENDTVKLYLDSSGYTGSAARQGENGSNGLALDIDGELLLCQSGNRQVVKWNAAYTSPKADYTILSATYKGKKFNSPNDLVADSKNNIYFTDPIYGLPQHENDPTRELKFEGVYKISPDGETTLLIDSISRPNGIALSPDEKIVYIASSDDIKPAWYAYHLTKNGDIKDGGILLNAVPLKEKALVKQGPDGVKTDAYGNLFSAGPDGINVISRDGKLLGLIRIYDRKTSNCTFNETKDILFITADDLLLKVRLHH